MTMSRFLRLGFLSVVTALIAGMDGGDARAGDR